MSLCYLTEKFRLKKLFSVITILIFACSTALASDACRKALSKRGLLTYKILFIKKDGVEVQEVYGTPLHVERVEEPHKILFRFYLSLDEAKLVLANSELVAGPLPYTEQSPKLTKYFVDLSGIVITTPEVGPREYGIPRAEKSYIDFQLPEGVEVLKLEPRLFLLPGPSGARPWLLNEYYKYKATGVMKTEYRRSFELWDKMGIPDPLRVKIKIVSSRLE